MLGWDIPQKCRRCNCEFLFPALNSGVDKASSQVGFAILLVSCLLETYYCALQIKFSQVIACAVVKSTST
jgi:hypothetical protein